MALTIASWNVNSVKARLPSVLEWLREASPDIALLQELKCEDHAFPRMEIEDLGYNIALHGQKTYNGVAILSKYPLDDVICRLPGDEADAQARYIEAVVSLKGSALRVASVYVPNGQEVGSDKFRYKLAFLDRLHEHMKSLLAYDEVLVIGGDYNVAPEAADVYDAKALDGTVCFHPDERAKLRGILHLGFADAFRLKRPHDTQFSWWDYRGGGYERGLGLRIDHLLLSPQATDLLAESWIDETPRRVEKPSDHAPVLCQLRVTGC